MKKLLLIVSTFIVYVNIQAQVRVAANNYVGVGISSSVTPLSPLHVGGSVYTPGGSSFFINSNTDNGVRLRLHNNGSNSYIDFYPSVYFRTSNSSSGLNNIPLTLTYGCVGVNNSSPSCALDVTGTIKMNGSTVTSDERLKDNIKNMSDALSSLSHLRGVTYKLKPIQTTNNGNTSLRTKLLTKTDSVTSVPSKLQELDSAYFSRNHMGFLAQEVQTVYPDLVYSDKNGILSVDYISLIPVLVESIKQQQILIEKLNATVEDLKKKVGSK